MNPTQLPKQHIGGDDVIVIAKAEVDRFLPLGPGSFRVSKRGIRGPKTTKRVRCFRNRDRFPL